MTGANKLILSVYSRFYLAENLEKTQLDVILLHCREILSNQDIRQLSNKGIPIVSKGITTKQQLLDYFYNEVKDLIVFSRTNENMKFSKANKRLSNSVRKKLRICI